MPTSLNFYIKTFSNTQNTIVAKNVVFYSHAFSLINFMQSDKVINN